MSNMFDNWSCRVFTSTQTQLLFVLGGKNPFDCIPRICWTCDTCVVALSIVTLIIAHVVIIIMYVNSRCYLSGLCCTIVLGIEHGIICINNYTQIEWNIKECGHQTWGTLILCNNCFKFLTCKIGGVHIIIEVDMKSCECDGS